ncbi:MAG: squalene/phytoene synthase family protein [Acidobacteriota bacterium]|jgi:phytoene synthase|nr:squalene/phytoene synthase family protein [Acidobacteriota bacterium]
MDQELTASYKFAAETVARSHSNFSRAFFVLTKEQRRAFSAVYTFMRFCDDVSDEAGSVEGKRDGLRRWRALLEEAGGGGGGESPDPRVLRILPAFRDTTRRFGIPAQYFHWIIDGTEMDLGIDRYETFEDLYRYCFRVASAVGLVCLRIFGLEDEGDADARARAEKLAEECGIAFQLTNILRDVREDAERGRIYLPLEDLRRFGYTEDDLRRRVVNDAFRDLMRFEAERAGGYYDKARDLAPLVKPRSRASLWMMMEVYRRLLRRIAERRYDVYRGRVRLSFGEKLGIFLRACLMRLSAR